MKALAVDDEADETKMEIAKRLNAAAADKDNDDDDMMLTLSQEGEARDKDNRRVPLYNKSLHV